MWRQEELYSDGVSYFDKILEELMGVRSSITVETYIFNDDVFGKKIVQALLKAAQRGVKVRVLVDGVGSLGSIAGLAESFKKSSVELGVYHPVFGAGLYRALRNLNQSKHR